MATGALIRNVLGLQIWFKHDLRLDDHPGLQKALTAGNDVIPVFCFDAAQLLHLLRVPHGLPGRI